MANKKVFTLSYGGVGYTVDDPEVIVDELNAILKNDPDTAEEWGIKVHYMDAEEFKELPEFDGF